MPSCHLQNLRQDHLGRRPTRHPGPRRRPGRPTLPRPRQGRTPRRQAAEQASEAQLTPLEIARGEARTEEVVAFSSRLGRPAVRLLEGEAGLAEDR